MTSGSITGISLAAADEVHDLHFVPFLEARGLVRPALDDDLVVLDSDAARIDAQLGEQGGDGERTGELIRLAIQTNRQPEVERTAGGGPLASLARRFLQSHRHVPLVAEDIADAGVAVAVRLVLSLIHI